MTDHETVGRGEVKLELGLLSADRREALLNLAVEGSTGTGAAGRGSWKGPAGKVLALLVVLGAVFGGGLWAGSRRTVAPAPEVVAGLGQATQSGEPKADPMPDRRPAGVPQVNAPESSDSVQRKPGLDTALKNEAKDQELNGPPKSAAEGNVASGPAVDPAELPTRVSVESRSGIQLGATLEVASKAAKSGFRRCRGAASRREIASALDNGLKVLVVREAPTSGQDVAKFLIFQHGAGPSFRVAYDAKRITNPKGKQEWELSLAKSVTLDELLKAAADCLPTMEKP